MAGDEFVALDRGDAVTLEVVEVAQLGGVFLIKLEDRRRMESVSFVPLRGPRRSRSLARRAVRVHNPVEVLLRPAEPPALVAIQDGR